MPNDRVPLRTPVAAALDSHLEQLVDAVPQFARSEHPNDYFHYRCAIGQRNDSTQCVERGLAAERLADVGRAVECGPMCQGDGAAHDTTARGKSKLTGQCFQTLLRIDGCRRRQRIKCDSGRVQARVRALRVREGDEPQRRLSGRVDDTVEDFVEHVEYRERVRPLQLDDRRRSTGQPQRGGDANRHEPRGVADNEIGDPLRDHAGELRRADEVPWQARHASLVAQDADAERNAEIAAR